MTKSLWTASAIAAATGGTCTGTWDAGDVSIDSRTVKKGDLFIALQGPNFDAHDFVSEAINKGAAGVMVSYMPAKTAPEKLVLVPDTFKGLQDLGAASRTRTKAKIIAVTGSVGKTGCKGALKQILSTQAASFASQGSYNNHWGVPLSLSRMPAETSYGIFELGMNHVGELGPLSKLVRPHIALITGIAAVHLGNFSGLDEIAQAKSEIFEGLEPSGTAVLNGDDAYFGKLKDYAVRAGVKNIARFGRGEGFEAKLEDAVLNAENSRVTAMVLSQRLSYTIGAPGAHWVSNSLAVLLCAGLAGADVKKAAQGFEKLELGNGRGAAKTIDFPGGSFTLVDDSYNASPVSVEAAIRVLAQRQPQPGGRRILVLGDMKELGARSQKLHAGLAPLIEASNISLVYACGSDMRHLIDALPEKLRGAWKHTSADLAPVVAAEIQDGDIVTVKGSHSMMMEKIIQALAALSQPQNLQPKKSAV